MAREASRESGPMYLHLELKTIPTDLRDQAVERLGRLHQLMSKSDGFLSAQMWADVSDPLEYMVTRAWADAEAHAGYRASDAAKAFAANRPPVPLWENTAVQEWISISAIENFGAGYFVARAIVRADAGLPDAPWARFRESHRCRRWQERDDAVAVLPANAARFCSAGEHSHYPGCTRSSPRLRFQADRLPAAFGLRRFSPLSNRAERHADCFQPLAKAAKTVAVQESA